MRVEFWGDDVEEVRCFAVADQRSLGPAEHGLWAPPCRELLLTDAGARARAAAGRRAPGAGRDARPPRRGHRRRGHGVAGAGARRRPAAGAARAAGRQPRPGLRPRAGPDPGRATWSAPARSSCEASLGGGRRRRHGADRPRCGRACRDASSEARDGRGGGWASPWWHVEPVRRRRRSLGSTPTRWRSTRTPAEDVPRRHRPRRWPTCGPGSRRLAGRAGHRGPRPGAARGRAARATADVPAAARRRSTAVPEPGLVTVPRGLLAGGFVARRAPARGAHRGRPHRPARPVDPGHAPDAVRRRRNAVDPLRSSPATTSCTSSTASAATSRWCSGRSAAATREYLVVEYAPASAASPATGCSCRPTRSTRSPGTSAARRPTLNRLGGADWAKTRAAPARRSGRSPAS